MRARTSGGGARTPSASSRPSICGMSFGGLIALRFAARRIRNASRGLCIASTPGPHVASSHGGTSSTRTLPWLFRSAVRRRDRPFRLRPAEMLRRFPSGGAAPLRARAAADASQAAVSISRMAATRAQPDRTRHDRRAAAAIVWCPTLIVTEPGARSRRRRRRLSVVDCTRRRSRGRERRSRTDRDISARSRHGAAQEFAASRVRQFVEDVIRTGRLAPQCMREIDGPAGRLEALLDEPEPAQRGVLGRRRCSIAGSASGMLAQPCVFAHPHPQFGGTMHTKAVYQSAKALTPDRLRRAAIQLPRRRQERGHASTMVTGEMDDFRAGAGLHARTLSGRASLGAPACRSARGSR